MTVIPKKSIKTNHKIFLIVIENISLLAAIYVGDDLAGL